MNYQDLQTRLERFIAKSRRQILKFTAKKRNQRRMLYAAGAAIIVALGAGLIVSQVSSHNNSLDYQLRQKSWQAARIKLTGELKKTQSEKATTEAEVQAKATHEADLQKQIDDLNQQLQAKKAAAAASIASRVVNTITGTQTAYAAPPVASGVISGCGDNTYANFIYMHESGCRLNATNPGGCVGIGQACPGSKLYAVCPDLNYACQNAFFTAYSAKYGGWAGAYAFWVANSWW